MKRDLQLIRNLLIYFEKQPAGSICQTVEIENDVDGATVGEHIQLLIDCGLVEGDVVDANLPAFVVQRLTWEGHEFLDSIKNDSVWRKIKTKAAEVGGGLTLEIMVALGKRYLSEQFGL